MRIDITKANEKFRLYINEELIMENQKLSLIVEKIEQYLKIRFLEEKQKGGISGFFNKIIYGK